jgi:hypothetical protein
VGVSGNSGSLFWPPTTIWVPPPSKGSPGYHQCLGCGGDLGSFIVGFTRYLKRYYYKRCIAARRSATGRC